MAQNLKYHNTDGYDWEPFRCNLRSLMDAYGYTGKDLALACGLAPTTVTRYLTERTPDVTALWRICDTFDVSMDWLVGRETSRYANLPENIKKISDLYSVATKEDRDVIDLILRKYEG